MTKERLGWEVFSKGLGRRQGGKLPISQTMHVNVAFKELVHRILEKARILFPLARKDEQRSN